MATQQLQVRLPKDLHERLKARAELRHVSLNETIVRALMYAIAAAESGGAEFTEVRKVIL